MSISNILAKTGRLIIIRHKSGSDWIDTVASGIFQKPKLDPFKARAGILVEGDGVVYFPPWYSLSELDKIIVDEEYNINSLDRVGPGSRTLYNKAILEKSNTQTTATFQGVDVIFYDDFGLHTEVWTVIDGVWAVVAEEYVGAAADAFSIAQSLSGQETWRNYTIQTKITPQSGNAALLFRYSGGDFLAAVLRVDEDLFTLEIYSGGMWIPLASYPTTLTHDTEYLVRVHAYSGIIVGLIDGVLGWAITDLTPSDGKLGLESIGGTSKYDEVTAWTN